MILPDCNFLHETKKIKCETTTLKQQVSCSVKVTESILPDWNFLQQVKCKHEIADQLFSQRD